jgi:caffeoyl-CoA O-methyltransferase
MALALPPGGKLVACDTSEEYTARARRTWREAGVEDRVELRLAPALETLDAMLAAGEAGTFDFVFIDADKVNYLNYYERAIALLRAGGLMAADNVLWKGEAADAAARAPGTQAIRDFNQAVGEDRRVTTSLATMGDGLLLALKL